MLQAREARDVAGRAKCASIIHQVPRLLFSLYVQIYDLERYLRRVEASFTAIQHRYYNAF